MSDLRSSDILMPELPLPGFMLKDLKQLKIQQKQVFSGSLSSRRKNAGTFLPRRFIIFGDCF